jgi:hypothetical protein
VCLSGLNSCPDWALLARHSRPRSIPIGEARPRPCSAIVTPPQQLRAASTHVLRDLKTMMSPIARGVTYFEAWAVISTLSVMFGAVVDWGR